jgi:hypothetical protein
MRTVFPTPIISNIQLVQSTLESAIQHHTKILLTPMGVFSQLQERIYCKNAQQIIRRNVEHVVIKL